MDTSKMHLCELLYEMLKSHRESCAEFSHFSIIPSTEGDYLDLVANNINGGTESIFSFDKVEELRKYLDPIITIL